MLVSGSTFAGLLLLFLIFGGLFSGSQEVQSTEELVPPDPERQPPASWSKLRIFKKSAVCADGAPCALIGK